MKIPKYSILITTYNTIETIRLSLESILSQIDDEFEVIVVDSYSTDGTLEYLKNLADRGKIRLITQKCTRGVGRQIALQHARGRYVIARVDMDEIYNPIIKTLAEYYVRKSKELGEFVLYAGQVGGFYFSTKRFMLSINGWKDLQWGENYELNKRLMDADKLWVCRVNLPKYHIKPKRSKLARSREIKISYYTYRDALRMGLRFSVLIKGINWTVPNQFARIPRIPLYYGPGFFTGPNKDTVHSRTLVGLNTMWTNVSVTKLTNSKNFILKKYCPYLQGAPIPKSKPFTVRGKLEDWLHDIGRLHKILEDVIGEGVKITF